MAEFSEIRSLRQKLGLSQRAVSEMLHVPLPTWEQWERGVRTPPEYVMELILFRLNAKAK